MAENKKNTQGGFLDIIIGILLVLVIMKLLDITVSEVIGWFQSFWIWFRSVFSDVLR